MRSTVSGVREKPRVLAITIILLGLSALLAGPVNAQSNELNAALNDKWVFSVGGFFPNLRTDVRIDSDLGNPGDKISLEDVLGLDDSKAVLWGGFRWRISRRNQLELEFTNLNNDGFSAARTDPIDIGDITIVGTASTNTEFRLRLVRLTYGFSVIRKEKHDLAVKGGIHLLNNKLDILAQGDILDVNTGLSICSPSPCQAGVGTDEYTFPLPHLGLSYDYAISPKLSLRTQLLGFAIKINDIRGALAEIDLDVRYQPWRHFGFGAGYRFFKLTVEDEENKFFRGEVEYEYNGPVLYFLGSF